MNVALTNHFEDFIRGLVEVGRYRDAGEVVQEALRVLEEKEGEVFPIGSLRHLYTEAANREEDELARSLGVPNPGEV